MRDRECVYDILRVLAIFLVAILHAWSMLNMDNPQYGLSCYLYRALVDAGVPLFVLISGALILSQPITSLSNFLRKRLTRVLVPFLFWATIVYVIGVVIHQYEEIETYKDALLCYVPYLLGNKINTSHWFVHMIVALYLLTPLLQHIIQSKEGKQLCEYMLIGIFLCLIFRWCFPSLFVLRYCSSLLSYLGLYIAGYYVTHFVKNMPHASIKFGLIAVVLFIINVCTHCPNHLLTQLMAVALFGAFVCVREWHIRKKTATLLVAISRYSYTIYFIHIPLIAAIYLLWNPVPRLWIPLLIGVLAVVLCALCCWIIDQLPHKWKGYLGIPS